jgi:hypothetical protein
MTGEMVKRSFTSPLKRLFNIAFPIAGTPITSAVAINIKSYFSF